MEGSLGSASASLADKSPNAPVQHPLLLADPWFMFTVMALYLYYVTFMGPLFMQFRKPYTLKKTILVHNMFQVLSCIYVMREILAISNNGILAFWKCVDMGASAQRYHNLAYFIFFLKLSELVETVIFVMRKKYAQVSRLHLFHHIATLSMAYGMVHYNKNGYAAFYCVFLNSIVHIFMYSYYTVAALAGKGLARSLLPVKKAITIVQMVQFVLILLQVPAQALACGVPTGVLVYFAAVISTMLYGFYDFYVATYERKSRRDQVSPASHEQ